MSSGPHKLFSRLSLSQQGVILVGILLGLELMFVGVLAWQVQGAEAEARREEHHKKILATTQGLQTAVYECVQALSKYAKTRDKTYSEEFDQKSRQIKQDLDWLKKALGNNKKRQLILSRIDSGINTGIGALIEGRHTFEQKGPVEALQILSASKNALSPVFTKLLLDVADLQREEEKIVNKSPEAQRRFRREIETILFVCVIVNVAFAIGLAQFFARAITNRLNIMVDNTQRFKNGIALNPQIDGSDEIAQLDRSFHAMAAEVSEAQKMKQTFVAMISHDLRTPLTAVNGYLSLVADGIMGELPAPVTSGAAKAERNVGRLIRLINDLLDLEKMEAGKMQMAAKNIYIENVIEKSIESVQEFAETYDIKLETSETVAEVYADPDRLIQVLINLISNAVKFSPKGETVEISTKEEREYIEVSVIDHGRGVPAKHRDLIFEKYKQVEVEDGSKKGGTGLGLPICKMIIEQSGGSIGVESEEGKGSRFWFRLPRISGETGIS